MRTLKEVIVDFLSGKKGGVGTLGEIYNAIDESDYVSNSDTVHESARAVIYRHEETFSRVCKGVYMLVGENTKSLLIEGDGRKLEEIEDNSIDCIITDHPWEDKKAHKSGNQKGFAEYPVFRYELDDFLAKARVLKDGCFLCEFLPVESATNWEYLNEIKNLAKQAGLRYYTHCIWRNAGEGEINTGKTTKGVQQIIIFSKGKPRKLSAPQIAGYQTKQILNYEIDMRLKARDKHHQAEKPIGLYRYLIERLTNEGEVCLDQFGGSCNLLKATTDSNRFGIVYELCHEFVVKAANRFKAITLYADNGEVTTEAPLKKEEPVIKTTASGQLCFF